MTTISHFDTDDMEKISGVSAQIEAIDVSDTNESIVHHKESPNSGYCGSSVDWLDDNETMGKEIIRAGEGFKCPRDTSECEVVIVQQSGPCLEGVRLDFVFDLPSKIVINECDSAIGRALEKVLLTVKMKEICFVFLKIRKIELYEGCLAHAKPDEDEKLIEFSFKLELISFQFVPEIYEIDDVTKIERASKHKEKGVVLYRSKLIFSAFYRFSKAVKLLIFVINPPSDKKSEHAALTVACHLNLAACQLQTKKYESVIKNCKKVLKLDDSNVKAYFRRGIAFLKTQEYEKARKDFDKVKEFDPSNIEVIDQLKIIDEKEKLLNNYYASRLKKMFN